MMMIVVVVYTLAAVVAVAGVVVLSDEVDVGLHATDQMKQGQNHTVSALLGQGMPDHYS